MQTSSATSTFYVAKLLKRLLDIGWYLSLLIGAGLVVLFIVFIVTKSNEVFFTLPVELSKQSLVGGEIKFTESAGLQAKLKAESALLVIKDSSLTFYTLGFLELVIYLVVVLATIYFLRGIFDDLLKRQPFTYKNARRVWYIGWVFLLMSPLKWLRVLFYTDYVQEAAAVAGYELQTWVPFFSKNLNEGQVRLAVDYHVEAVFVGLLLLVLAEVFRQGVALRSENEAFV